MSGPGDGSLLREPINKEKISLKKGNAAVSKGEVKILVAFHSTASRYKASSLCDAVWYCIFPSSHYQHLLYSSLSASLHTFSFLSTATCISPCPHLSVCLSFPSTLSVMKTAEPSAIPFGKSVVTTTHFSGLKAEHMIH